MVTGTLTESPLAASTGGVAVTVPSSPTETFHPSTVSGAEKGLTLLPSASVRRRSRSMIGRPLASLSSELFATPGVVFRRS